MLVEMLSHSTVFTENSAVYRGMINGRRRDPIEIQCFCKLILNMSNYLCITCFYLILGKNDSFYKLKQCIRTSSESATFTYNFKSRCFTKNIFQFTYLNIFFFLYEKNIFPPYYIWHVHYFELPYTFMFIQLGGNAQTTNVVSPPYSSQTKLWYKLN